MVYRFGTFALDTRLRELRREDQLVHVQPRVFEILLYLVSNADRAVSREELLLEVWRTVSVEDGSVSRAIRGARAALASDPSLRDAIQTVRGYGYRLGVEVESQRPLGARSPRIDDSNQPFVGRAAQITRIGEAAAIAAHGERRVVLIIGEPGAGKSTLARRTLADLPADFVVGEGQCLEGFGQRTPYLPMIEAITNLSRTADERDRKAILDGIKQTAPTWVGQLPLLFGGIAPQTRPIGLSQDQMQREILDAIEFSAGDRPIALLIEDLQWADQSTLGLLASIAMRSVPSRLLLVCTARTAEIDLVEGLRDLRNDLARSAHGVELEADLLSAEEIEDYLRQSIGTAPEDRIPRHIVDWIHQRTSGHPLFLAQLVDHLKSLELLDPSAQPAITLAQMDSAGVPDSLGQLILQWIGRLAETDRRFLEVASVAGFDFDARSVQAALGLGEDETEDVEATCDRLCAQGWLHFHCSESWPDQTVGSRMRFAHVMYSAALYAQLPPSQTGRLHRQIAERLERGHAGHRALASQIAAHYERGGDRRAAARHRVAASVHAASHQAVDEALHHAQRGLDELQYLLPEERDAAESDLRISTALMLAARDGFGHDHVGEHFRRAYELARRCGETDREMAAAWGLSACLQMRGEIEAAKEAAERLLALAQRAEDAGYISFTLALLNVIAYFQGRFADCVAYAHAAIEVLRQNPGATIATHAIQDTEVTVSVYAAMSSWHLGEVEEGRVLLASALSRARLLAQPFTESYAEAFTAIFHHRLGESERQREHAARGFAIAEAAGIPLWREVSRFMEICADPVTPEQLSKLGETLKSMAQGGGLGGTFFIALLAELEIEAGSIENAQTLCNIGFAMAERTTENNNLPALYLAAARIADDPAQRNELFAKAEACAQELGSVAFEAKIASSRSAEDRIVRPS